MDATWAWARPMKSTPLLQRARIIGVALPGLAAGLLIVLLTVLWGRFDARKTGQATPPTAERQFLAPSVQVIPSAAPIEAIPAVSDQPAAPAPSAK